VIGRALSLACGLALSGCWHDSAPSDSIPATGTFLPLGTLAGSLGSEAAGVSADGRVVVGTAHSRSGVREAFRWSSPQGMSSLGLLANGTFASASAVSADGTASAGNADGGQPIGLHAFRWTVDSGITQIRGLRDSSVCAANAISDDGAVVVGTCLAPTSEAVRWTVGQEPVGLGRFGTGSGATSAATAVSGDGLVIGGAGHPALTGAILWNATNVPMVIGGLPGDTRGSLTALSRDGAIATGVSVDSGDHERAFRWTAMSGAVPLERTARFVATRSTAISRDGRWIAGWGSSDVGADVAVIWDEAGRLHVVSDLLASDGRAMSAGWTLTRARGLSADGRVIVGDGIDPSGAAEAWRVTLRD